MKERDMSLKGVANRTNNICVTGKTKHELDIYLIEIFKRWTKVGKIYFWGNLNKVFGVHSIWGWN